MKHFIEGHNCIKNGDMALTITGKEARVLLCDYAIFHAKWAGSGVSGKIKFEVSLSSAPNEIEWYELESEEYDIATDSGDCELNLERLAHGLIRAKYVPTLGNGVINIKMNAKSIGG
jgi:hypothetical protein